MTKVKVIQVYKATREVVIDIDEDDGLSALEQVQVGNLDLPDFDDPRWETRWILEIEDYELVG